MMLPPPVPPRASSSSNPPTPTSPAVSAVESPVQSPLRRGETADSILEACLQKSPELIASPATPVEMSPTTPADKLENGPMTVKNPGRARYMRFHRTLTTNKGDRAAPPEVLKKVQEMSKKGRGSYTFLYEDWMQASEDWCAQ